VLADLGQTPLPPGKYTQMRLVLGANDSATPLANSVVPTGGSEVPLTTPSGQQTGVKMNIDIDIAANKMADFVLDFDACKSVVHAGASGSYLLKPVVSVIAHFVSGVLAFDSASTAVSAGVYVSVEGHVAGGTLIADSVRVLGQSFFDARTYQVSGPISGLDVTGKTFVVRNVVVDYSSAQYVNGSAAGLANGVVLRVNGSLSSDGTQIQATQIAFQ